MSQEVVLFILRVVAALTLLAFVGVIAWLIYRDIKLLTAIQSEEYDERGFLQLIMVDSEKKEELSQFPLLPVTSIGRSASNTVVLDHEFVSSRHALITLRGTQWWIEDLGSRNGTQLNEHPLNAASVITAGDIISIGPIKLRIAL